MHTRTPGNAPSFPNWRCAAPSGTNACGGHGRRDPRSAHRAHPRHRPPNIAPPRATGLRIDRRIATPTLPSRPRCSSASVRRRQRSVRRRAADGHPRKLRRDHHLDASGARFAVAAPRPSAPGRGTRPAGHRGHREGTGASLRPGLRPLISAGRLGGRPPVQTITVSWAPGRAPTTTAAAARGPDAPCRGPGGEAL